MRGQGPMLFEALLAHEETHYAFTYVCYDCAAAI